MLHWLSWHRQINWKLRPKTAHFSSFLASKLMFLHKKARFWLKKRPHRSLFCHTDLSHRNHRIHRNIQPTAVPIILIILIFKVPQKLQKLQKFGLRPMPCGQKSYDPKRIISAFPAISIGRLKNSCIGYDVREHEFHESHEYSRTGWKFLRFLRFLRYD